MCLPVKNLAGTHDAYSISKNELKSKYDYFGTLVALGNLHFTNPENNQLKKAIKLLRNISQVVKAAGPAFSSLSGSVNDDEVTLETLR